MSENHELYYATCHVCGEERPRSWIHEYRRTVTKPGYTMRETIHYCADRDACYLALPATGTVIDRG